MESLEYKDDMVILTIECIRCPAKETIKDETEADCYFSANCGGWEEECGAWYCRKCLGENYADVY